MEPGEILQGAELYNAIQIWREALVALVLSRIELTAGEVDRAVTRLQKSRGVYVKL